MKQVYETIATVLRDISPLNIGEGDARSHYIQWEATVDKLATAFYMNDSTFDRGEWFNYVNGPCANTGHLQVAPHCEAGVTHL